MKTTIFSMLATVAILCALPAAAQQGYTASTGEAVWGGSSEHRDISLTNTGEITNGSRVFRMESLMPANPLDNSGLYKFDYKIKQHVITPVYNGSIVYYVNSKDGSIAVTAEENPQIKHSIRRDLGDFHFGIRKADGNLLLCGLYKNEHTGRMEKRGIDLGKNHDVNTLLNGMIWEQMSWLNSAEVLSAEGLVDALSPTQIEILETSSVDGLRGKITAEGGRQQTIDFYFVPFPVLERVSVPFMGLNAGIMKNYEKKINQLIIYSVVHDVEWKGSRTNLHFYLEGLYRADATFLPGEYIITTAFNKQGTADAQQLQQQFIQLSQRAQQLQQLIRNCPKGNEGKACREPYQHELKEIQKKMEQGAKEFINKNKL